MIKVFLISFLILCVQSQSLNTKCVVPNTEVVQHIPHEFDCAKFYKCDNGKACKKFNLILNFTIFHGFSQI